MSSANPQSSSKAGSAAGAPSHEPSMEEILASIRRIIADDQSLPTRSADISDPRQGAEPAVHVLRAAYQSDHAAHQRREDAEPHEYSQEPSGMMAAHGAIAAPQFASPDGPGVAGDGNLAEYSSHTVTLPSVGDAVGGEGVGDGPISEGWPVDPQAESWQDSAEPPDEHPHVEMLATPHRQSKFSPQSERGSREEEVFKGGFVDHQPDVRKASEDEIDTSAWTEQAPHLFSEATDQSVASAFNMLAATRLADNSDELLSLARDMIRPLLRTWIDENLPGMVERMIRAEIERVARGGR